MLKSRIASPKRGSAMKRAGDFLLAQLLKGGNVVFGAKTLAAAQQARGPVEPPERFPVIGACVFSPGRRERQRPAASKARQAHKYALRWRDVRSPSRVTPCPLQRHQKQLRRPPYHRGEGRRSACRRQAEDQNRLIRRISARSGQRRHRDWRLPARRGRDPRQPTMRQHSQSRDSSYILPS